MTHADDNITVTCAADGSFTFTSEHFHIHARSGVGHDCSAPAAFQQTDVGDGRLAGLSGTIITQVAASASVRLTRQFFQSDDGSLVAVRLGFTNLTDQPVALANLIPLRADGEDGVRVAGRGMADWQVLRMSRHKNDVPGVYRPAERDLDWKHARVDGAEFRAGMGGTSAERSCQRLDEQTIAAEPGVCIRSRNTAEKPVVFLGVLGQTEHLSEIQLRSADASGALAVLSVIAEFDHVRVDPQQSRTTHWAVVMSGEDEQALLSRFAEMLATEMHAAPPPAPPTVYCSWYFYGQDFTEDDLRENLEQLKDRPIRFDVLVIDNGWMDDFGRWNAGARFPSGMEHAAKMIAAGGFTPGIWTCPFVFSPDSPVVQRHPRLVLRNADGEPCTFPYKEPGLSVSLYVLDPTAPEAEPYLREMYGRLESLGFHFHKLDFLRSIIVAAHPRFCDPHATRAQAYRRALGIIRDAIGPGSYLLVCGGLFEASAGLADGVRIGSDVKGRWYEPDGGISYLIRIKQNIFRNYTNRLWHTDPDALQIRRRTGPFRGQVGYAHLSDGSLNDDEALTCLVNQYIGGGLVCLTERLAELDESRRRMFRHVIPSVTPPARVLDVDRPMCPTLFLTTVQPRALELKPWWTLAVSNWADQPVEREVRLPPLPVSGRLAVFELMTQQWLSIHETGDVIRLTIPAHGSRILRIAPWSGRSPMLIGTDAHFSGGAAEIEKLTITDTGVRGRLASGVEGPIRLTFACPVGGDVEIRSMTLDNVPAFDILWHQCSSQISRRPLRPAIGSANLQPSAESPL